MAPRICFVTGAGGFVGRALVGALVAAGHQVRALDVRFPLEWPQEVQRLDGDICDAARLRQGCGGADWVFHLAALLPQRRAPAAEMRRVNVDGVRALLDAALAAGVQRVVMLSSAEVYGVPRGVPCPEDAPACPLGEYGRNKVEAEQLAQAAAARGLPLVILRPPTVVGPGMPERLLRAMLSALRRGLPIAVPAGRRRFQMIAVSDLVHACLIAAEAAHANGDAFNLGSDNVPAQLEMARRLRDRVGSRSMIVPIPRSVLRVVFQVLGAIGRSPLEPEHAPIALCDYVFDIRKARECLGWQPAKDNVEALADAYDWLARAGGSPADGVESVLPRRAP